MLVIFQNKMRKTRKLQFWWLIDEQGTSISLIYKKFNTDTRIWTVVHVIVLYKEIKFTKHSLSVVSIFVNNSHSKYSYWYDNIWKTFEMKVTLCALSFCVHTSCYRKAVVIISLPVDISSDKSFLMLH